MYGYAWRLSFLSGAAAVAVNFGAAQADPIVVPTPPAVTPSIIQTTNPPSATCQQQLKNPTI